MFVVDLRELEGQRTRWKFNEEDKEGQGRTVIALRVMQFTFPRFGRATTLRTGWEGGGQGTFDGHVPIPVSISRESFTTSHRNVHLSLAGERVAIGLLPNRLH